MSMLREFVMNETVFYLMSPGVSATGSGNVNLGSGLVQRSRLRMVAG